MLGKSKESGLDEDVTCCGVQNKLSCSTAAEKQENDVKFHPAFKKFHPYFFNFFPLLGI